MYHYALFLINVGRPWQAEPHLRTCIRLDPTHVKAYLSLQKVYQATPGVSKSQEAQMYEEVARALQPRLDALPDPVTDPWVRDYADLLYNAGTVHLGSLGMGDKNIFKVPPSPDLRHRDLGLDGITGHGFGGRSGAADVPVWRTSSRLAGWPAVR